MLEKSMKKVAIIYSKLIPLVDILKYQLELDSFAQVKIIQEEAITDYNLSSYDLVILTDDNIQYNAKALYCHHSLLPAFNCKYPEKEAIINGVKVTGITICYSNPQKILAQYPVYITCDTHYDELLQEIMYVEQTLFPLVTKKILNNEQFESKDLIKTSHCCTGNCGGCNGCKH
jgi:folate-dependent phosphoribosylglycinamide formyltransferase PurN